MDLIENEGKKYLDFLKTVEKKLVIIVNLKDLRDNGANISYRLSWEKTVEDTLYQIKNNSKLKILKQCEVLIVRIGLEGTLVIHNPGTDSENFNGNLFFDVYAFEDEFLENSEGNRQGISLSFLSGIVNHMIKNPEDKIGINAIKNGLNLARMTWIWGYGHENEPVLVPHEIIQFSKLPKKEKEKKR